MLNYDKFSLEDSENLILELTKNQQIDFVILDEVHYAKKRGSIEENREISQRHTNLVGMMTEIRKQNKDVKVLGMTATPVINDLMEGRSLIELVTGKIYDDVSVKPTIHNAVMLYEKLQLMSVREMPNYHVNVNVNDVHIEAHTDEDIKTLVRNPSQLEQQLTDARIPEIVKRINGQTIIFSEYVTGITNQIRDAIRTKGYTYAEFTGSLKELQQFLDKKVQVLIASRPIAIGIDGLQKICDNLIINILPWTNAQYQQLVGRLVRSGQISQNVNVHIIKASLNGYPYDERMKWNRIIFKRTLADCAVDGVMPIRNLVTPAQASKELIAWYDRLDRNEISTVERQDLNVHLSPKEIQERIRIYGDFSLMNKQYNQEISDTTHNRIADNPMYLVEYHRQMREAKKDWSVIPVQIIADKIKILQSRRFIKSLIVGDFGCGEAELAAILSENKVYSYDHHNILNENIIACNMKHTLLENNDLDVVVFSLSLMGQDWRDYIKEAKRCLTSGGYLMIAETTRSLSENGAFVSNGEGRLYNLREVLDEEGFSIIEDEQHGNFTYIQAVKR